VVPMRTELSVEILAGISTRFMVID
jgi:hypothetical protein